MPTGKAFNIMIVFTLRVWCRMRIARVTVSCLLLLIVASLLLSSASAQTTSITNLRYPIGRVSSGSVTVTFDLTYSGLSSSEVLSAFILYSGTENFAEGTGSSTPNSCLSLARSVELSGKAACAWLLSSSSGTEHLTFNLDFAEHIQTYHLTAATGVVKTTGGVSAIESSFSAQDFSITAGNMAELTITTTFPVAVTVDGSTTVSDPIELTPGTHSVSVPALVQLDNVSRLRFDHWEDGSKEANRSINVQVDTSIEGTFVKQYMLNLIAPAVNATGAGWYDEGSTAHFSVPSSQPVAGFLGVLGGKLVFKGWYENGRLLISSNSGAIQMQDPHTLNAEWTTDYVLPIAIFSAVAVIVVAMAVISVTRRRTRK
jgi:hypothetical protein